ncbi:MAG: efflux RND transporter periplasmic adaptor subunit [Balneolaceae bacterium]
MLTALPLKKTILLVFLSLFWLSCSSSEENQDTSSQNNNSTSQVIPAVEAVQARYGSLPLVERFSGNVRSENQVPLFPQISAKIEAVFVENGMYVEKGTKLVQLEDEQFRQQLVQAEAGHNINKARLKQAEASLAELTSRFNRTKQLADKDLSSDVELEQIQAQLTSAEADVELAKAQVVQSESLVKERQETLKRTIITAPISGTIGQRNAQVGMQVSNNTELFMIGDLSKLRVEIVLTESMLNKISIGQTALIMVEDYQGNDQIITANLSRISPFLNEITRSTEAEIDVENTNGWLKPGMFVPVDILFGESEQATLIPVSAIYTDPTSGIEGVYVASSLGSEIEPANDANSGNALDPLTEPTQMQFKVIDVRARGRMEVGVNGLESGQWVVTLGQDLLGEGREQARVRTTSWNKVVELQKLQREDLLKDALRRSTNKKTDTL